MRWLALKDLQILRRSPLLVGLLLVYAVGLSLLVGTAVDSGPQRPRVAVVNEIPADANRFKLGNEEIDARETARELYKAIDPIEVDTREKGIELVRNGTAVAALIIPANLPDRLQGAFNLTGGPKPTVEIVYASDNPLKAQRVQTAINSRVADANRVLTLRLTRVAAQYLRIILRGGEFKLLGQSLEVLGLENAARIVAAVQQTLPAGDPQRAGLQRVERFARVAIDNLDFSDQILATIGAPIDLKSSPLPGGTSASAFYFATALALSLMLICVLLAAGLLSLEREEHAFGRLVRGLVSRTAIVAEKALLAAALGVVASAIMLGVLAAAYGLDVGRVPAALGVMAIAGAAFGAFGVAVGAAGREVRAASLLAVLVLLPIAALGFVPSGATSPGLYDVVRGVSGAFPFRPALLGIQDAIDGNGVAAQLGHLAALAVAYGAIARVALRRFG
jgi:ABC-2 type transport system permease protein